MTDFSDGVREAFLRADEDRKAFRENARTKGLFRAYKEELPDTLGHSTGKLVRDVVDCVGYIAVSALLGELMDHVPYMHTAIPHAIEGITRSNYFYGNLDKLGAALGFVNVYLSRRR